MANAIAPPAPPVLAPLEHIDWSRPSFSNEQLRGKTIPNFVNQNVQGALSSFWISLKTLSIGPSKGEKECFRVS